MALSLSQGGALGKPGQPLRAVVIRPLLYLPTSSDARAAQATLAPPLQYRRACNLKLVDWHEPLGPLCRQDFDLLEIQDRGFALSDDCRPLALLG